MLEHKDHTLPDDMQTCLRACMETSRILRRHQAAFTSSSSALAQLLQDWSRRQILHHMQTEKHLSADDAADQAEAWLTRFAA